MFSDYCPYCSKKIDQQKYLKKWFFKITELCPHCGEPIARDKLNQPTKLGRKHLKIQYAIIILFFVLAFLYLIILRIS